MIYLLLCICRCGGTCCGCSKRSELQPQYVRAKRNLLLYICRCGGTGRRTGFKIQRETMWVRVPPSVPKNTPAKLEHFCLTVTPSFLLLIFQSLLSQFSIHKSEKSPYCWQFHFVLKAFFHRSPKRNSKIVFSRPFNTSFIFS